MLVKKNQLEVTAEELHQREGLFFVLAQLSPVGIYLTDAAGRCVFVNDAWCGMAGLTEAEAMGDGWRNGLHPDDRKWIAEEWHNVAEQGGKWTFEYRFVDKSGRSTWVLGYAKALYDNDRLTGYLGINIDITERKRQVETLERQVDLDRKIIESTIGTPHLVACCSCNMIRLEDGGWIPAQDIEKAKLAKITSHGMCPICAQKWQNSLLKSFSQID